MVGVQEKNEQFPEIQHQKGRSMTTTTHTFDPTTDPFSVTYAALTTGKSSWSGGFKCITINGQPALTYLTMSEMTWGEYYQFMRGIGDFSATRIAEVLTDDTVIAGIRRCFVSRVLSSSNKADIVAVIERNVQAVLRAARRPQDDATEVQSHMIGQSPVARSKVTEDVALANLFQTEAAVKDITKIVDIAEAAQDPATAQELIAEVFSYALPDAQATEEIDAQIARGMGILLENRTSVEQIFHLFESGYPAGIDEHEKLQRFIPLFIQSLSLVQYPVEALQAFLTLLSTKAQGSAQTLELVNAAQDFVGAIAGSGKKHEDICHVALPLLQKMVCTWPCEKGSEGAKTIKAYADEFRRTQAYLVHGQKQSLPGLTSFATLLSSSQIDVHDIFALRPFSERTGDEAKDFSLFFHHVVEAAKFSGAPALVLHKALPLLADHVQGTEYQSLVEDLDLFLPILGEDVSITQNAIIPLLKEIVPKTGKKPTVEPEEARKKIAEAVFTFVKSSANFSKLLERCLPILEQHIPEEYGALMNDVRRLLSVDKIPEEVVKRIIVPLLEQVISIGTAPQIDPSKACSLIADTIFVLHQDQEALKNCAYGSFEEVCTKIENAAVDILQRAKAHAIQSVHEQAKDYKGASPVFACMAVFIFSLGSWLALDGEHVNVHFLPRVREVFFGARGETRRREEASAPLAPDDRQMLDQTLLSLSQAPDAHYHEILQRAKVPAIIRGWAASS